MIRALCLMVVFCCAIASEGAARASADTQFEALANAYIEEHLRMYPETATDLGDHRYDHLLGDYSEDALMARARMMKETLQKLKRISPRRLSAVNRLDHRIFEDALESSILEIETIREWEWNPLVYNPGNTIYPLMARDYAPAAERLRSAKSRLLQIPKLLENAKANLKNPPKIHTETAIQQIRGSIGLVTTELDRFIQEAPEMRDEMAPAQATASAAIEAYAIWLEKELLPRSNGDFRLGDRKFRQRLRYSLNSTLSARQILRNARRELARTQDEMFEVAWPLYQAFFPRRAKLMYKEDVDRKMVIRDVLAKLADDHPTNDNIVDLAKEAFKECVAFVKEKEIVTVPNAAFQIIVMPEFRRGVAVAYCDAPGALATNEATFYAISPTPADWSEERKRSFYREYNNYMLKNLTVHEAVPGHYLQLIQGNRFEAPTRIRAVFTSGIFAEGWATYTEEVMVAHGFGGPEVKMQQLKMRLRLIINAILDQGVHTDGMTEAEAMRLMMEEGFQEEGEAAGKWRRACLTSTQLSTYFVGNLEINDLVAEYRKRNPGLSERQVHDEVISHGTAPPKYLKEFLLSRR